MSTGKIVAFFPERCLEKVEEPKGQDSGRHYHDSYWTAVPFQERVPVSGVELLSVNRKGGFVVRLTYIIEGDFDRKIGKDSLEVVRNTFSDMDPSLKLCSMWIGLVRDYVDTALDFYLQYSPVKR